MNLIYIVCPGHSGSTLLDMLLGINDEVFSTGELNHLPNQYHRNKLFTPAPSNGLSCSCGTTFYKCNFWGKIIQELNNKLDYDIFKTPLKFKIGFLMNHERPHLRVKHKLFREIILFSIKSKLPNIDKLLQPDFDTLIKNNELLISLIHKLSKRKIIVDSTKDYFRLHYLLKSNINIKVVVLVRSILGVAASNKKLNKNPIAAAHHWIKYYNKLEYLLALNEVNPITIQ